MPPLLYERREFLNREKNPYFNHAEAEYFLAWRDGEPVGRITAQVDRRWDEFQGGSDGQFGFIECRGRPGDLRGPARRREDWVRERGRERMVGPMDFTTNDECGILIEGYEREPLILEPWHPPYYQERVEALGYGKTMDLLMWKLEIGGLKQGDASPTRSTRLADKVESEHGITVRNMSKRDLETEIARFMEVYNAAWEKNWGFVPITEEEVALPGQEPEADPGRELGVDRRARRRGARRRADPPGHQPGASEDERAPAAVRLVRFLLGKRKIDRVRVFALGVKPEYQHTGIAARFYVRHIETAAEAADGGEMGWILEVNEPMNRAMEGMGGTVVKRYRLYEKSL